MSQPGWGGKSRFFEKTVGTTSPGYFLDYCCGWPHKWETGSMYMGYSTFVTETICLMVVADYEKRTSLLAVALGIFFQMFKAKVNYLTFFTCPKD